MNHAGIGNLDYRGTKLNVSFGDFLRGYCFQHGVDFGQPYVFGCVVLAPLRDLLRRVKVQVWAELAFGFSYHAYRVLDGYVRIFGAGIISPEEEAHYLLNIEFAASPRRLTDLKSGISAAHGIHGARRGVSPSGTWILWPRWWPVMRGSIVLQFIAAMYCRAICEHDCDLRVRGYA